jgi:hypothetical protein
MNPGQPFANQITQTGDQVGKEMQPSRDLIGHRGCDSYVMADAWNKSLSTSPMPAPWEVGSGIFWELFAPGVSEALMERER